MSDRIPVFWLEPTDAVRVSLRRYSSSDGPDVCPANPGQYSYHHASVDIGEAPAPFGERDDRKVLERLPQLPHDDQRWPRACSCGHVFADDDHWQTNQDLLYRASHNGQLYTLRDAPVCAMWDAWWMSEWDRGPDGSCLVVRTPGGDWMVDGEASNCTRPQRETRDDGHTYRTARTHYCWVRHGDPRQPATLHVDKDGETCAADAGSIIAGSYHGFLHHGHLVPA